MSNSRGQKKLVRRLMAAKGRNYQGALTELRTLPEGTSWREYVERVEKQKVDGTLLDARAQKEIRKC